MVLVLFAVLAASVVTDLRSRRIPNALTGGGALAALACGAAGDGRRLAAGAGACAVFGAAALVRPDGMGLGDAKLAGVMGLCLGPPVAGALLAACLAAVLYGLGVAVVRGAAAARALAVPFAPFLALGAVMAAP